jgi:hypothetical protein
MTLKFDVIRMKEINLLLPHQMGLQGPGTTKEN